MLSGVCSQNWSALNAPAATAFNTCRAFLARATRALRKASKARPSSRADPPRTPPLAMFNHQLPRSLRRSMQCCACSIASQRCHLKSFEICLLALAVLLAACGKPKSAEGSVASSLPVSSVAQGSVTTQPGDGKKDIQSPEYSRLLSLLGGKDLVQIENMLGQPFDSYQSSECRRSCFQGSYDATFPCTSFERRYHFNGVEVALGIEEAKVTGLFVKGLPFSTARDALAAFGLIADTTPVGIPNIEGKISGNARWTPCDENAFYRRGDVVYSVEFSFFPDSRGWLSFRDDTLAPGTRKPKEKTRLR